MEAQCDMDELTKCILVTLTADLRTMLGAAEHAKLNGGNVSEYDTEPHGEQIITCMRHLC